MRAFVFLALFLLVCAPAAMANIPPAPQAFAGLILLQLSILLFSLLGGAYTILHKQRPSVLSGWIWRVLLSLFMIMLFSIPEVSFIIALVYGGIAVKRAIKMLLWSGKCKSGTFPALEGAGSLRLLFSGIGLLLASAISLSLVFVFYQPWSGHYRDDDRLLGLLKGKLCFGMENKLPNGHPYYNTDGDENFNNNRFKIIYGRNYETFTILVLPDKLPSWTYNLLVSMPSMRADQSGQIRMVLVHNNFEEWPPDAPVVHTVDEQELSEPLTPSGLSRRNAWMEGKPVW